MISLEEADDEMQGKKVPAAEGAGEIEDAETDETIKDDAEDTFIEEVEEDADISEIIDGDIKDEDET
jgi:hypothetical protein